MRLNSQRSKMKRVINIKRDIRKILIKLRLSVQIFAVKLEIEREKTNDKLNTFKLYRFDKLKIICVSY